MLGSRYKLLNIKAKEISTNKKNPQEKYQKSEQCHQHSKTGYGSHFPAQCSAQRASFRNPKSNSSRGSYSNLLFGGFCKVRN